jgi:hypothetical protein
LGEPDANRHRFLAGCFSSYRANGLVRLKSAETLIAAHPKLSCAKPEYREDVRACGIPRVLRAD